MQPPEIDLDDLGGRLHESIRLLARPGRPYVIRRDLTVMPGVTLTIEPGAELEFYPSVGILVLGTLHAQGNIDRNIIKVFWQKLAWRRACWLPVPGNASLG